MLSRTVALVAGLAFLGSAAIAQTPPPTRVRGTITAIEGNAVSLTARNGDKLVVTLTPDAKVTAVTTAQLADIKPGSFIGSAAVPLPDGSLKALEITVFPPAMNGTGEGHYDWDLGVSSTMTNGTVGDLVVSNGRVITVRYKGGEKKISVPDDVPVVSLEAADRSLLTPGAHVLVVPAKAADGTLTASRINVGRNGTIPPM